MTGVQNQEDTRPSALRVLCIVMFFCGYLVLLAGACAVGWKAGEFVSEMEREERMEYWYPAGACSHSFRLSPCG